MSFALLAPFIGQASQPASQPASSLTYSHLFFSSSFFFLLPLAFPRYDPSRGFRFSTYASWWIQQAVFRAVAFQSRIIRLPMHIHNLLNRVRNTRKDMFMETGVIPTDAELAGRLGVSIDKLRLVLNSSRRTYSSSAPLKVRRRRGSGASGEGEMSFEDSTQSSTGSGARSDDMLPEEFVEGLLFRSEIHDVLDVLDDDERFVVTLRYGLGVPRRLSMGEIAEMAGTGKVDIDISVDPSLIGGFVVSLGSQVIDASLAGQVRRLGLALAKAS